jgi:hypothetical protein
MDIIETIAKIQEFVGAICVVMAGLIALFMMIPGEQPEKALQSALDFLKRFSKK